jgi:hypothetical protein
MGGRGALSPYSNGSTKKLLHKGPVINNEGRTAGVLRGGQGHFHLIQNYVGQSYLISDRTDLQGESQGHLTVKSCPNVQSMSQ